MFLLIHHTLTNNIVEVQETKLVRYQTLPADAVGGVALPAGRPEREPALVSVDEVEAMRHALVLARDPTRTVRVLWG